MTTPDIHALAARRVHDCNNGAVSAPAISPWNEAQAQLSAPANALPTPEATND